MRAAVIDDSCMTRGRDAVAAQAGFEAGGRAVHGARAIIHSARAIIHRRLEHDPEKWIPVFGKDHAPTRALERDDVHHALMLAGGFLEGGALLGARLPL